MFEPPVWQVSVKMRNGSYMYQSAAQKESLSLRHEVEIISI